jgi:predicted nucleic acid-binding protein
MAFLFDTDAISELLRPHPLTAYRHWIENVERQDQFTSAVVVGELYKGAYRSANQEKHLVNIEHLVLPAVTVLPYDTAVSKVFGAVRARLEMAGMMLPDADLQIAATAIYHGLVLVTGNVRHFRRIRELKIETILSDTRRFFTVK